MDSKISLAGSVFLLKDFSPELARRFERYAAEEDRTPDAVVETGAEDLREIREGFAREDDPAAYTDSEIEYIAIQKKIADWFAGRDVYLFHASALAVNGRAAAFTAPSGTGKSTHARLWRENVPGVVMINDDKPFLKRTPDGEILVCGSPWNGKHDLGEPAMVPLDAVFFLKQADPGLPEKERNRIRPLKPVEAFQRMYLQIYRPQGKAAMERVMPFLNDFLHKVRLYELTCSADPEAALTAWRAFCGKRPH